MTEDTFIQRRTKIQKILKRYNFDSVLDFINGGTSRYDISRLPGIGFYTSEKIVESRPFKNIDELSSVYGIGKSTLEYLTDRETITLHQKDFHTVINIFRKFILPYEGYHENDLNISYVKFQIEFPSDLKFKIKKFLKHHNINVK